MAILLPALVTALALGAPPVSADTQARIDAAIARGIAYLRLREPDFEREIDTAGYPRGISCLAYYTLLMSGVPADDPLCARLLPTVRGSASEVDHTYTQSLALLGLLAGERERNRGAIIEIIGRLEAGQRSGHKAGAWGYVVPQTSTASLGRATVHPEAHWDPPQDWWDHSNTQYALLALRAAVDFGFQVDGAVFERAVRHSLGRQAADGGFGYAETFRAGSYTAMTAGMGGSLAMCAGVLPRVPENEKLRAAADAGAARAAKWIGQHLSFPPRDGPWPYYAAYAVERLGHYAGAEKFGKHAWYEEGARWLLENQEANGSFRGDRRLGGADVAPNGNSVVVNTCFALLFLKRASAVHTEMSDEVLVLLRGISPQSRRADLDDVKQRILRHGTGALELLVKGLYLESEPARLLADECLRELTGKDMEYAAANGDLERRRAREAWVQYALATRRASGKP